VPRLSRLVKRKTIKKVRKMLKCLMNIAKRTALSRLGFGLVEMMAKMRSENY